MKAFDNLGMRAKLFWFASLTGGVLAIAIAFTLFQVNRISAETQVIAEKALPGLEAASQLSQLRLRYRVRSLGTCCPTHRRTRPRSRPRSTRSTPR